MLARDPLAQDSHQVTTDNLDFSDLVKPRLLPTSCANFSGGSPKDPFVTLLKDVSETMCGGYQRWLAAFPVSCGRYLRVVLHEGPC